MRAMVVEAYGGPAALVAQETPAPEPRAGEVRIKVTATGVNYIDTYRRSGQYKGQLPMIVGGEAAGTVDAVGAGVSDIKVGDVVASAAVNGAYAEQAIIPAAAAVPVPDGLDPRLAAAVMLQGMTAHYLCYSTFPLKAGQTCVVHAAAGGVGRLLVQMAKALGARVIATCGTDAKAELARSAGADDVIVYTRDDFTAETRRLTGGRGVEVVYDSVGKTTFDGSIDCLMPRGYLVLYGQSSGAVPPIDPQMLNAKGSLFLTRPSLGAYTLTREELLWRSGDLFGWMRDGKLEVIIDQAYPLSDAPRAHEYLEARQTKGKVLLIP